MTRNATRPASRSRNVSRIVPSFAPSRPHSPLFLRGRAAHLLDFTPEGRRKAGPSASDRAPANDQVIDRQHDYRADEGDEDAVELDTVRGRMTDCVEDEAPHQG